MAPQVKFIVEDWTWSHSWFGEGWQLCTAEHCPSASDRFPRWLRGQCAAFRTHTHILLPKEKHEIISLSRGISAANTPWPSNLPVPFLYVSSFLLPCFVEGFSFVFWFCFLWPAPCGSLAPGKFWMRPLCLLNCMCPARQRWSLSLPRASALQIAQPFVREFSQALCAGGSAPLSSPFIF